MLEAAPPFDLIIVGGGPAGIAAANLLSGRGLSIAVIDEQQRPGGQIARQPPAAFRVRNWLQGQTYRPIKSALARFAAADDIAWHGGRSVIDLQQTADGFRLVVSDPTGIEEYRTRHVLLATGCYDLPVPRSGWTLPGTMSAGGIQTLLKGQQLLPAGPLVLAGTHPLMILVAEQVVAAGGTIAMLAFQQSLTAMIRALWAAPVTTLRNLPLLAGVLVSLATLRRKRVPLRFGLSLVGIEGHEAVAAARFIGGNGQCETIACTTVGLCYGFIPQSDLSRRVGADVRWAPPAGGWATRHDAWMRSSIPGLYVAGETAGVGGASSALIEGNLAVLGLLQDIGGLDARDALRAARPLWRRQRSRRRFAALLAAIGDPELALAQTLPPDTILCRCEDVAVGQADEAIARGGSANAIKLETRIGMGLCQARSCEHMLLRRIARHNGTPVADVTGFTVRFPIRPVRIGDLARPRIVAPDATKSSTPGD
jgi:thioredoxin reductase